MLDLPPAIREQALVSAIVLRAHLDKTYPGAMVASLSVPWGHTGNQLGGYHLVWPRDLVECAGALLALGAEPEARDTLRYLIATQNEDGHWNQNQWLGGTPYWQGLQLDETALPVLLADRARGARRAARHRGRGHGAPRARLHRAHRTVDRSRTAGRRTRASTPSRWRCASRRWSPARRCCRTPKRDWALALADFWNAQIEAWTTVTGTELARQYDVPGYYVRVAPPGIVTEAGASTAIVPIRNRRRRRRAARRPADRHRIPAAGALRAAPRRRPADPGLAQLADALLRTDTPTGPVWHRYRGDGYGEHEDGRAFDGTGIGRGWPLLTGERGHFEL